MSLHYLAPEAVFDEQLIEDPFLPLWMEYALGTSNDSYYEYAVDLYDTSFQHLEGSPVGPLVRTHRFSVEEIYCQNQAGVDVSDFIGQALLDHAQLYVDVDLKLLTDEEKLSRYREIGADGPWDVPDYEMCRNQSQYRRWPLPFDLEETLDRTAGDLLSHLREWISRNQLRQPSSLIIS